MKNLIKTDIKIDSLKESSSPIGKSKLMEVETTIELTNKVSKYTYDYLENKAIERLEQVYNAGLEKESDEIHYKALFLKSILTQDEQAYKEILFKKDLKHTPEDSLLFVLKEKKTVLNSLAVLKLIQKILDKQNEKDLLVILMNTFQSIPESTFLYKNENCITMKDKKIIVSLLIEGVDEKKQKFVKSQLTDLSFHPSLPAFRPSIGDPNYIPSSIKFDVYQAMLKKQTDVSEFIILTIGFLRSQNIADKLFLQKLAVDYLFVNYDDCVFSIQQYFEQLSDTKYDQILNYSNKFREFNHNKNDPRRFFETRLSQYINGLSHSKNSLNHLILKDKKDLYSDEELRTDTLLAVNKILKFFLGEHGFVDNPKDMEQKISIFAQGYKDSSKFSKEELEFITSLRKRKDIVFSGTDRVPREYSTQIRERKYETEPDKVGFDVWNYSGGTMKGGSPIFVDALCGPIRNMLVDATQVAEINTEQPQWYWNNNRKYSAYVGSVSGHACEIVGMLILYMRANAKDKNLEKDLQLFLVQLIAVYAKRGYHSILEVIDVLHDNPIQELFEKYNVTINLYNYFSRKEATAHLEYAMNDTLHYTQALVSKYHVKMELQKHRFFKQEHETHCKKEDHINQISIKL